MPQIECFLGSRAGLMLVACHVELLDGLVDVELETNNSGEAQGQSGCSSIECSDPLKFGDGFTKMGECDGRIGGSGLIFDFEVVEGLAK